MLNPTRYSAAVVGLLASMAFLPSCALSLRPLESSIDAELEDAVSRGFDGIIVYVDQPGGSSLHSAGWKDREAQVLADPRALFKIASISKLYIAAATTMLVADGELRLDSTLVELLPEVGGKIEHADAITLRMMLRHRSGIPEYIYHPDFTNDPDDSYMDTASLVYDASADFPPDARYRYSNTNFLLIGEILEVVPRVVTGRRGLRCLQRRGERLFQTTAVAVCHAVMGTIPKEARRRSGESRATRGHRCVPRPPTDRVPWP